MLWAWEAPRPHFLRIAFDRPFDRGSKFAESFDEFRDPGGKPEHILQDEDLTVARRAGANAMVGMATCSVIRRPSGSATASITMENAPASATALASASMGAQSRSSRPWARKDPIVLIA